MQESIRHPLLHYEERARGRASPLSQVDSPCWPQASTPQGTRPAAWSRLQRARAGVAFEWELRAAVPQKAAGPRRRSSSHEAGESLAGAAPWIVTEAELVCHNMHRGSVDPWVGEVGDVTPAMVARGGLVPGTTASNAPALHGSGRDPAERWLSPRGGRGPLASHVEHGTNPRTSSSGLRSDSVVNDSVLWLTQVGG